ncbi:fermentation/respiration switch protein,exosortase A system-associated hydrolase 1,Alpha/beta hydrolase family [Chlamydia serpentis]|uniref:Fermentation/respiration switch protein,exosortase A system-associated hydrolase 1,Alpha/beta hydrolase family n=1 Tax=Chlamydia serpentis TaxID=1967782 RepID=A0A2R8FA67_9CHLA|nr:alpha/beta hydrolase [Chlamydia serpentis]SPN73313.1 fermentation/respiration switch protein,exosortase A system-associated hydrolase 1,Alpha/beta hydrolase family [Chlamydia serpentis]
MYKAIFLAAFLFSIILKTSAAPIQIPGFPQIPEELAQISTQVHPKQEVCFAITIPCSDYNLLGVLHLPNTPTPESGFPIVIVFHGFRGTKFGGLTGSYRQLGRKLAAAGIATLRVDMAGCGDSEEFAQDISIANYLRDAYTILETVKEHPDLNAYRLGVAGFSLGCHIAFELAKIYNPSELNIKALSLWAPIADGAILLKELYENFTKHGEEDIVSLGQDFGFGAPPLILRPGDAELLIRIQDHVIANSLPKKTYILHQQGSNDSLVSSTQQMLFKNTAPGRMVFSTYNNTGHNLATAPDLGTILDEIVNHFKERL